MRASHIKLQLVRSHPGSQRDEGGPRRRAHGVGQQMGSPGRAQVPCAPARMALGTDASRHHPGPLPTASTRDTPLRSHCPGAALGAPPQAHPGGRTVVPPSGHLPPRLSPGGQQAASRKPQGTSATTREREPPANEPGTRTKARRCTQPLRKSPHYTWPQPHRTERGRHNAL